MSSASRARFSVLVVICAVVCAGAAPGEASRAATTVQSTHTSPVVAAGPDSGTPPSVVPVPSSPVPVVLPVVRATGKPKQPSATVPVGAPAAGGIPIVALNAYRHAAAVLARTQPSCGIDWSLLAGIGRVESDHGRFGGAVLNADGTSTPRIIGIALDGTRSALIRDTDHGVLDGDRVYDHAVGPMQFIPSTWAVWGADGNGDGKRDPFNINDAALAAADYLCAAGGNLRTISGQSVAVLAYNHSAAYLAEVLALARSYATGVTVVVSPILPPSTRSMLPPVNPGPPLAAAVSVLPSPAVSRPSAPKSSVTSASPSGGLTVAPSESSPSPGGSCPPTARSGTAPAPQVTPGAPGTDGSGVVTVTGSATATPSVPATASTVSVSASVTSAGC